jgi:hypothetical protein
VDAWSGETNAFLFLSAQSARASASFMLIVASSTSDRMVNKSTGETVYLHGPTRECYQRLLVQLNNLRGIMEKPDVYFYQSLE